MIIFEIIGWFALSAVIMSFIEHQVHQKLMHKRSIEPFRKTFEAHAITHHTKHYLKVFSDEPVPRGEDKEIQMTTAKAPIKALTVAIPLAFISWHGSLAFILTVTFHHWVWNNIHLEMHKPEGKAFSKWPIYKFLARYHWLHHRYPDKNLNVVFPLADYVLGTSAKATEEDERRMHEEFEKPKEKTPVKV